MNQPWRSSLETRNSNADYTDGEYSADNDTFSDDDTSPAARVRDRPTTSLETQKYWENLGVDKDFMQADMSHGSKSRSTVRKKRSGQMRSHANEFDEGYSDDNQDSIRSRSRSPKYIDPNAPAEPQPRRLSYATQDRAPSRPPRGTSPYVSHSRERLRTPLRASAPHLRDPYYFDERSHLLSMADADSDYNATRLQKQIPAEQLSSNLSQKSTFWQTWFNAVNALVGVGILSMPLVLGEAGWLGGAFLFLLCGFVTNYTGKLIARILAHDPQLKTYVDIGRYAFGPRARYWIAIMFCAEMILVSVALIILMGDSVFVLYYGQDQEPKPWALFAFKVAGFVLVLPTVFLPLSFLSPVSLVGITSILFTIIVLLIDGCVKRSTPGSLWNPAITELGPRLKGMGIGFGLLMSGFASHPILPSLYRDMRHPEQFDRMLDLAYLATAALYATMGIAGYLMFGIDVSDEVTSDMARTRGMPHFLTTACVVLMIINSMSKFSLALRPVQNFFESVLDLSPDHHALATSHAGDESDLDASNAHGSGEPSQVPRIPGLHQIHSRFGIHMARHALAVALAVAVLCMAVVLPSLERVMGFLGAFLTFNTCILGPIIAGLFVFAAERKCLSNVSDILMLSVTSVLALLGTLYTLHPTL
ncbi:hypothetical protein MNAN1_003438 [Malassezia nana]|uniref:Amino acid transporter transmembrane domain-containing protein n=1 Tax=Malassezia nana TaxID=180528 RepID=A0AAF0EU11_9BASI|nr:hypothetical protein MNAN1_003438 [Malassezia nana]